MFSHQMNKYFVI